MEQKEMKKYKDSFKSNESHNILILKQEMRKSSEVGYNYIVSPIQLSKQEVNLLGKEGYIVKQFPDSPMRKTIVWFDLDAYESQKKKNKEKK